MTFLMHKILRLKASAEHTQFRKLEVSVSLLTPNNFFDSYKREKCLEKHDVKKTDLQREREILISVTKAE